MRSSTNFADPAFEPTDEELTTLAAEAFGGVAAANRDAQRHLRDRIATLRAESILRSSELLERLSAGHE
ncbi:MAG: hypothetical protein JNK45_21190 [Myxococcales bacterium]|nr:hypothetical protein [Myxococcales bacterium]